MADDLAFYRRREQQELAIARCAMSAEIAAIHAAMARRYAALAQMHPCPDTVPARSGDASLTA